MLSRDRKEDNRRHGDQRHLRNKVIVTTLKIILKLKYVIHV